MRKKVKREAFEVDQVMPGIGGKDCATGIERGSATLPKGGYAIADSPLVRSIGSLREEPPAIHSYCMAFDDIIAVLDISCFSTFGKVMITFHHE